MEQDQTQFQSPTELEHSEKLSREGSRPPSEVPGYDIQSLIGAGAYGEVWSGIDRNTGRKVAIKFYSRRSSVDFSLLTREVEKLASLAADRYVVQLLDVGWDSVPPFYVMDFIENGSLEDELHRRGVFPTNEAIEMFYEVAIGLMHLHNKGILHCDLKPGNVLLDGDHKPRLADFGQSRLSSEQAPALGTLFYMAPEQANLTAIPDAKWDVFALGALMYCMLTGSPPYRSPETIANLESASEINERLLRYQKALNSAGTARLHRELPGVDKQLADIIDRCITVNPNQRYGNVQSILLALRQREETRARKPLMLLGLFGPILLLTIMTVLGWMLYSRSMDKAEQGLMDKARESNSWAAQFASKTATDEIDKFFSSVHRLSRNKIFLDTFVEVLADNQLSEIRERLSDPNATGANRELITQFEANPVRKRLQPLLQEQLDDAALKDASWFATDAKGTQIAFVSEDNKYTTIGKNYCWRTYFSGKPSDFKEITAAGEYYPVPAGPRQHIRVSHISAIFISQASNRWKVAFSKPIYIDGQFMGVVAATVHCGDLVASIQEDNIKKNDQINQYAMLVDFRGGPNQGAILGHPYFETYTSRGEKLPTELLQQTIDLKNTSAKEIFQDPLAKYDPRFSGEWVLGKQNIVRTNFDSLPLQNEDTGMMVLALEDAGKVMKPVNELSRQFRIIGIISLAMVVFVGIGLWLMAIRTAKESRERVSRVFRSATETTTLEKEPT
jgi:eukaryotic-like serine/threonine-protein kinase